MNAKSKILAEIKYLGIDAEMVLDIMDEEIRDWHTGSNDIPLHEYLGFTWVEYGYFVTHPDHFAVAILRTPFSSN